MLPSEVEEHHKMVIIQHEEIHIVKRTASNKLDRASYINTIHNSLDALTRKYCSLCLSGPLIVSNVYARYVDALSSKRSNQLTVEL